MRNLENTRRAFDASFVESADEEEEKVGAYVKDHAFLSPHLMRVIDEYRAVKRPLVVDRTFRKAYALLP